MVGELIGYGAGRVDDGIVGVDRKDCRDGGAFEGLSELELPGFGESPVCGKLGVLPAEVVLRACIDRKHDGKEGQ